MVTHSDKAAVNYLLQGMHNRFLLVYQCNRVREKYVIHSQSSHPILVIYPVLLLGQRTTAVRS